MTMMPNQNTKRSRTIDRILNSRGAEPSPAPDTPQGEAFIESGGKPQMSFSVERASGEIDGFHYYNLDNIKFTPTKSGDHISFDHRGKVVTVSGVNLKPVFKALMGHTLILIRYTSLPSNENIEIQKIEIDYL